MEYSPGHQYSRLAARVQRSSRFRMSNFVRDAANGGKRIPTTISFKTFVIVSAFVLKVGRHRLLNTATRQLPKRARIHLVSSTLSPAPCEPKSVCIGRASIHAYFVFIIFLFYVIIFVQCVHQPFNQQIIHFAQFPESVNDSLYKWHQAQ